MNYSALNESKEEFVKGIQAKAGEMAGQIYDWLDEGSRSMTEVEEEVSRVMREMGQGLLTAACGLYVPRYPAEKVPCSCGNEAEYVRRRQGQTRTQLDWIQLKRPYYLCAHCHRGQYPLDQQLGFRAGQMSQGFANLLAYVGVLLPFEEGAGLIETFLGVTVSPTLVGQATEELGSLVAEQEREAIAAAWQPTTAEGHLLPSVPQEIPHVLYVSMDGVNVLTREEGWKEQKLGAIYTAKSVPSRKRPDLEEIRASEISFYTAMCDAQSFGQGLWLEAHRRGVFHAPCLVVIGDGAHWIWRLAEEHFPAAIQILDWYHVTEYIWKAAHALYGDNRDAAQWANQRLDEIWNGQLDSLLEHLESHRHVHPVQDALTYFQNNRQRMDYPRYRRMGLQVGSGTIESGCKHVIAHRLKQAGMRWSFKGLQAVAKLRARFKSGRWAETIALRFSPLHFCATPATL